MAKIFNSTSAALTQPTQREREREREENSSLCSPGEEPYKNIVETILMLVHTPTQCNMGVVGLRCFNAEMLHTCLNRSGQTFFYLKIVAIVYTYI